MKHYLLILLIAFTSSSCKKGIAGFICPESENFASFKQQKVLENKPPKEIISKDLSKVSDFDNTHKSTAVVPKDSIPNHFKKRQASSEIISQIDPKLEKNNTLEKNKQAEPKDNVNSREKLFFNLITSFSVIYPFCLIGLPLLLLFTSELKNVALH